MSTGFFTAAPVSGSYGEAFGRRYSSFYGWLDSSVVFSLWSRLASHLLVLCAFIRLKWVLSPFSFWSSFFFFFFKSLVSIQRDDGAQHALLTQSRSKNSITLTQQTLTLTLFKYFNVSKCLNSRLWRLKTLKVGNVQKNLFFRSQPSILNVNGRVGGHGREGGSVHLVEVSVTGWNGAFFCFL